MNCRRLYQPTHNGVVCISAWFDLSFDYQSERSGALPIRIKTSLTPYARNQSFYPPLFPYAMHPPSDYERIQLLPFRENFWLSQRKYGLPDVAHKNDAFLSNPLTISNNQLNNILSWNKGLFEHPYLFWNANNRLGLRQFQEDVSTSRAGIPANSYQIGTKILLLPQEYPGGYVVETFTVVDPKATFYHLVVDSLALCTVNIWIDLVEMERRKLQQDFQAHPGWNAQEVRERYQACINQLDRLKQTYFTEVQRGKNLDQLVKWNKIVVNGLNRDHLDFFKIRYEDKAQEN